MRGAPLREAAYIELAYRIPNRISSLLLAATTPGGFICNNLPPVRCSSLVRKLQTHLKYDFQKVERNL